MLVIKLRLVDNDANCSKHAVAVANDRLYLSFLFCKIRFLSIEDEGVNVQLMAGCSAVWCCLTTGVDE